MVKADAEYRAKPDPTISVHDLQRALDRYLTMSQTRDLVRLLKEVMYNNDWKKKPDLNSLCAKTVYPLWELLVGLSSVACFTHYSLKMAVLALHWEAPVVLLTA